VRAACRCLDPACLIVGGFTYLLGNSPVTSCVFSSLKIKEGCPVPEKGLPVGGVCRGYRSGRIRGLRLAMSNTYDAIVLDVMLPKMSGLEVLEELRRQRITTPILILTARSDVEDRVKGLNSGR